MSAAYIEEQRKSLEIRLKKKKKAEEELNTVRQMLKFSSRIGAPGRSSAVATEPNPSTFAHINYKTLAKV